MKREIYNRVNRKEGILIGLFTLIICFTIGITIIFHYLFSTYSWYWVIFTWLAIFPLLLLIWFIISNTSNKKFNSKQIKAGNARALLLIFWYWFLDIVYMVIFNKRTIWIYILIPISLIKIFYDLTFVFLNKKTKSSFFNVIMIINFLIGLGLTVYLIFIIRDESLRQILTAIISSVYGGLLTLVGVAWTIKHANNDKKEEEIKRNKPFIFIVDTKHSSTDIQTRVLIDNQNIFKTSFNSGDRYSINSFVIENADFSYSILKGICINNELIALNVAQALRKNGQYLIICDFNLLYNKDITNLSLLLIDMLENYYLLKVNFEVKEEKKFKRKEITIISGIEIVKAKVNFKEMKAEEIPYI